MSSPYVQYYSCRLYAQLFSLHINVLYTTLAMASGKGVMPVESMYTSTVCHKYQVSGTAKDKRYTVYHIECHDIPWLVMRTKSHIRRDTWLRVAARVTYLTRSKQHKATGPMRNQVDADLRNSRNAIRQQLLDLPSKMGRFLQAQ